MSLLSRNEGFVCPGYLTTLVATLVIAIATSCSNEQHSRSTPITDQAIQELHQTQISNTEKIDEANIDPVYKPWLKGKLREIFDDDSENSEHTYNNMTEFQTRPVFQNGIRVTATVNLSLNQSFEDLNRLDGSNVEPKEKLDINITDLITRLITNGILQKDQAENFKAGLAQNFHLLISDPSFDKGKYKTKMQIDLRPNSTIRIQLGNINDDLNYLEDLRSSNADTTTIKRVELELREMTNDIVGKGRYFLQAI